MDEDGTVHSEVFDFVILKQSCCLSGVRSCDLCCQHTQASKPSPKTLALWLLADLVSPVGARSRSMTHSEAAVHRQCRGRQRQCRQLAACFQPGSWLTGQCATSSGQRAATLQQHNVYNSRLLQQRR